MRSINLGALVLGASVAAAMFMSGTDAKSDGTSNGGGVPAVYGNFPADQVEFLSTPEHILSVAAGGAGSSAIWETLEHGEAVECLDCVPVVEHLLYDTDPETREISAWWMRKRMFGVFGPGEAYERNLAVLKSDADPQKRAYAASAVGEFLTLAGVGPLSDAIKTDTSPKVRAAAAHALGRMNSDGAGALSVAMIDSDESVRLAGIDSAGRVNSFADVATATKLIGDSSPLVRRRSAELLEDLHAKDSIVGLIALVQNDPDAAVRGSAAHALGALHDASAKTSLQHAADTDTDSRVRDQATIALRRL